MSENELKIIHQDKRDIEVYRVNEHGVATQLVAELTRVSRYRLWRVTFITKPECVAAPDIEDVGYLEYCTEHKRYEFDEASNSDMHCFSADFDKSIKMMIEILEKRHEAI